jgi:hypothetical integral membrane protein (TIGR02206 family)
VITCGGGPDTSKACADVDSAIQLMTLLICCSGCTCCPTFRSYADVPGPVSADSDPQRLEAAQHVVQEFGGSELTPIPERIKQPRAVDGIKLLVANLPDGAKGCPELLEVVLAAVAFQQIGSALLVWIGRSQTESQARRLGRTLGALTAAIYGSVLAYSLVPPTIEGSVPLRLTDLATVAAACALWSQRHWPCALTYYWGLTLSTQALISPALTSPDFPNHEFLGFWSIHLLVVWAAIYLTWGRRMRPQWRSYWIAVLVTVLWAAVTFTFNSIAGTDYGFLNGKPHTASLLDVLGPWPVYLLSAATLILIVWALMTWPWERIGRHAKEGPQLG